MTATEHAATEHAPTAIDPTVSSERFLSNAVTPYMWSRVDRTAEGDAILGSWATVLGIVPLHRVEQRIARADLASAEVGSAFHPDRALMAVAFAVVAALGGDRPWLRWPAVVLAGAMVPLSFVAVFRITTRAGRRFEAPICLLMIPRAKQTAARIVES